MKKKYIPLTDTDMNYFLNHEVDIKTYKDLDKNYINNMKNGQHTIILYPVRGDNDGHWCVFSKNHNNNNYRFFDPYGFKCDEKLKGYPKLLSLFNPKSNTYRYQVLNDDINTCGRHCAFYIFLDKKYNVNTHTEYKKWMQELKKLLQTDYDNIVTSMINRDAVKDP